MKTLFVILLAICFMLVGCGKTIETSAPPQELPKLIATFEGTGEAISDQFSIQGNSGSWDFSVSWSCTTKYVEAFGIYVHLINIENPILESNPPGQDKGTMKVHYFENVSSSEAPFVIEVIAPHKCDWSIEIWQ